jgi:hypothetical protein
MIGGPPRIHRSDERRDRFPTRLREPLERNPKLRLQRDTGTVSGERKAPLDQAGQWTAPRCGCLALILPQEPLEQMRPTKFGRWIRRSKCVIVVVRPRQTGPRGGAQLIDL